MDDTQKMLAKIINGQSDLKDELLNKIGKLASELSNFRNEISDSFNNINRRIDKLGKQ